MADETPAEQAEQWKVVGEQIFASLVVALTKSDASKFVTSVLGDVVGGLVATGVALTAPIGIGFARGIAKSEDLVAPALSEMAAAAVSDMFGTHVPASAFEGGIQHGRRKPAADALAAGLIKQLQGDGGALVPSGAAAERYLGVVVNMALEGWYQKWFFEFMTSLIPQLNIGKIENFGTLDDKMAAALGFSRLTRRVLSPIVDATIVAPLRWHTNKTYRPELLGVSETVRQFLRGHWTTEKMREELARQGWSDERIDAHINAQQKFFSAADVRTFVDREHWSHDRGLQHLRDQGFSEDAAADALRLEGLRRIDQLESAEATALIAAYVDRRLTRSEFLGLLADAIHSPTERALLEELAETRLVINRKSLSPSEARACVKAGILAVIDYRAALRNDGYDDEAVTALELLLRHELDDARSIAQHRAELEAERIAEKVTRDAEKAARKAAIEAERALARRGDESDLERAAIRGLVPFARVEELYRPRYDADTIAILVDLLEDARADYVASQKAASEAKQRAGRRALDVGTLERAYLAGVLTTDRLQAHPTWQQFSAGDQAILLADFGRQKREQDAAAAIKADATATAGRRGIDLGRIERLVRLGARTLGYYDQQLAALGFGEGARADMRELLEREIAADAEARRLRKDHEPALLAKGLSLEQFRQAVVLGTKTDRDFDVFLTQQGFTDDARVVLLADVRAAVADAEAARRRRDQPSPGPAAPVLSLTRVAQAARLGIVTPATYAARLRRDGYTEDDLAIEMELLLAEIAAVQAARATRDALEATSATPTLSLGQVERAVKAGTATIADYRGTAAQLGYSADDTALLVTTLDAELGTRAAARRRRDEIDADLQPRHLSIAQLEATVKGGLKSVAEFLADVQALGYALEDAELLAVLLVDELEATAEP